MLRMAMGAGMMAGLACIGVAQACEDWNTVEFFETAAAADVQFCLDGGAAIDARDENGMTPLHTAAGWIGDPAVIRILAAAGADVGARDSDGWTPLHFRGGQELGRVDHHCPGGGGRG